MTFEILDPLADRAALRAFLELPQAVYRGDPDYCAPAAGSVAASLDRAEFAGAQRAMLAVADGEPAARIVARVSPRLRDDGGRPYGVLGFFEALDRPDAVARLFAAAIGWLRQAGAGPVVGPMDGDTWHRYRLNAGPFDEPPFLSEPYNPPYYPALWEGCGFQVVERYLSKRVEAEAVVRHLKLRARGALAAGYRLRRLDLGRFDAELARLYELSRAIFAGNFLYSEIPEREFAALYAGARPLLDPDLIWFALAPGGGEVGFLFAYPDYFRAVAAMRGRRGLRAKLAFLRHRRRATAVDFKTLGVLPAHRRAGVAAALFHRGHAAALDQGYSIAHHCLIREGNPSDDLDGGAGRLLRRYHLYRLAEGAGA